MQLPREPLGRFHRHLMSRARALAVQTLTQLAVRPNLCLSTVYTHCHSLRPRARVSSAIARDMLCSHPAAMELSLAMHDASFFPPVEALPLFCGGAGNDLAFAAVCVY